jgi:Fe2+ or Zn2+ uptake regulation protein
METSELEHELRAAALRVTAPRVAVLREVHERPHADVETIAAAARSRLGSVSTQAVYDVLRVLTHRGLVRRIEPAGSPARFEARVGDNHHHVVCRVCGAVADVDCATGSVPCLQASDDNGFLIDEAEVTYWGLCPDCRADERTDGAPATPAFGRHAAPSRISHRRAQRLDGPFTHHPTTTKEQR